MIFIIMGTMHSNSDFFESAAYCHIDICHMTRDSHCFTEEKDDMVHTVSINRNPSHQYNIMVKSTKTLQFQHISHGYSNLPYSQ
jgi:hypothetical protein